MFIFLSPLRSADLPMLEEKTLINKILKGDLHSFKTLIERYENLVFCVIRRLLNKTEDVEDIAQEVFIKVHQNLARFNFEAKLSTWIAQIAYNTALNHLKKLNRESLTFYTKPVKDIFLSAEDLDQMLVKSDVAAYLDKLIAQLPEQYRIVITLYHLKEFSYEEIETITGMPGGTVKSYLFRARKMLKEKLAQYLKNEQL